VNSQGQKQMNEKAQNNRNTNLADALPKCGIEHAAWREEMQKIFA
jgi:hypothetical protein